MIPDLVKIGTIPLKNYQRKKYFILKELAVDCGPSTVDNLTLPGIGCH
jgi:hypothetical protein